MRYHRPGGAATKLSSHLHLLGLNSRLALDFSLHIINIADDGAAALIMITNLGVAETIQFASADGVELEDAVSSCCGE
jgi:hypothetical protein